MVNLQKILIRSIIAGIFIFGIQFFIEKIQKPNLVGFFYGSVPYTFIFLSLIYFIENRQILIKKLSLSAAFGGLFFVLYMFLFYLLFGIFKINYISTIFLSAILLFISLFLSNEGYKKIIKFLKISNKYPKNLFDYLNTKSND
jgi:hypothetical protein